jgi:hypothetical protein
MAETMVLVDSGVHGLVRGGMDKVRGCPQRLDEGGTVILLNYAPPVADIRRDSVSYNYDLCNGQNYGRAG